MEIIPSSAPKVMKKVGISYNIKGNINVPKAPPNLPEKNPRPTSLPLIGVSVSSASVVKVDAKTIPAENHSQKRNSVNGSALKLKRDSVHDPQPMQVTGFRPILSSITKAESDPVPNEAQSITPDVSVVIWR